MSEYNPIVIKNGQLSELSSFDSVIANISAISIKVKNIAGTFFNYITANTTASRTWTFQDKDYIIAGLDDITSVDVIVNPYTSTPSGVIDGINRTFTLPAIPNNQELLIFINGLKQYKIQDYSFQSNNIIFSSAPILGDVLEVFYIVSSMQYKSGLQFQTGFQVTLDLGNVPVTTKKISTTITGILPSSKINAWVQTKVNSLSDELELDPILISASCSENDIIDFYISSVCFISGQYLINYSVTN